MILFKDKASVPFHRNGSYLAEDGCPDSQVLLAKQLLEENDRKCLSYWYKLT